MTLAPRLLPALIAALPLAAIAETALTVYSSARPGTLDPNVFRNGGEGMPVPGYALVREQRAFTLEAGRNAVRVTDVPALIDPTTVSFASLTHPQATRVVEQSFEFDLTSTTKLLSRYLDREITVEQPRGDRVEAVSGTLVGTLGGLTLRQPDGSIRVVEQRSGIRLPSLPGGLISKPTLAWDIETSARGTHQARMSYQTGGMTWWTDYNLTYSEPRPGECRLDVSAWVTLVNRSGASYRDARLKLVAGDVQRVQPRDVGMRVAAAPAARAMEDRAEGFAQKAFFEYHLYTLGRRTTLPDNSTKQIELFPTASGASCDKTLVYQGQAMPGYYGSPLLERQLGTPSNRKVDVYLRVRNAKSNALGMPLPAGKVRVAQQDRADGTLEFIGEDLIGHTAADETVQVKLGSAFDVVGERKQLDFRLDTSAKWMEEDVEVRVRNQKPGETVSVIVKEHAYRWSAWSVPRKTHEFTKEDSRTLHFPLKIAPKAEAVVRYTVRYTW
jgi:hypothetical protein